MEMATRVYMADLRHNFGGVLSTDCMPLSVGYMKAVIDRDLPGREFDVQIFAYPADLLRAMKEAPPDVLMVSNYVWNERLSAFFLRRAKALNPRALTVMGGPNICVEAERQIEFVAQRPEIDVYVLGEGDFLAREIVRMFAESGNSVKRLVERDIPSSVTRRDGTIVRMEPWDRDGGGDVNDIPSPWLTGVMDKFFDGKLAPIIETNRGCPFKCSFCVQGTSYYNKISSFEMDRLQAEIDRIAELIRTRSPQMGTLRIADANYGMYPRDPEISAYIGEAQKRTGWPTFIDATTGKNKPERIIESMEKVNGALVLYQAVQSLDEEVLRNIRRSNIKLAAYEQLQVHIRGRGMRSVSDLILGLPGESLASHIAALHKLIDAGTNSAHCFQAMMLPGADMESLETRRLFEFDTRWRVLPKNFGAYDGEKVFDIEEIIVATDTLPFDDYIQCRKNHVTFSVFWNDSWFNDIVDVAVRLGVKPSEWLTAMLETMEADGGAMKRFLDDFVGETKGELFSSREECETFYAMPDNFERLERGEIGDNLMYKYRALASFYIWKDVCALAVRATATLLKERGLADRIRNFDAVWHDLGRYVEAKHATGVAAAEITAPVRFELSYDIPRWLAAGAPEETAPYRWSSPRQYIFELTPEGAEEMTKALQVWSSKITGLSKLVTRIRVQSQVRACRLAGDESAAA
jgi:radical SAM superfamily enzyme YgiQ (UPF0313 family)